MSRRSWKTANDTKAATSSRYDAIVRERQQRSELRATLQAAARPFDASSVKARLDRRDELDRANSAARLAAYKRVDLGEP